MAEKTYHVAMSTWASADVTVTVDLDGLSEQDAKDKLRDLAYEELPGLCHHCSGGRLGSKAGVDLGDEWEITEVLGEDGKVLDGE